METSPHEKDKCGFCGKSTKDGPEHTAGYSRRERFAQTGPWKDACQSCARIPYEQPAQFQTQEDTSAGF